ncbi:MAG: glycosyltransferase family 2 protein [Anaerolineales bacterium]|jgi:glycosyltransferase involved in cell wall biosynthesis
MKSTISVIVPAMNEEDAVAATVQNIQQALTGLEYEIIVVDDGSEDATAARAREAGARVIRHPHNLGYGAALKTGIRQAQFDTIVITDADGTYPNEQIPLLLAEYEKGFDMVVGARRGQNYLESVVKAPLRLLLKFLVEYTTGRKAPDVNSGLRVFSREKVLPYFNHLSNAFSFTTSMTLAYSMNSLFVSYVPIPYHARVGKTKVHLLRDTLRTLQYVVEGITYYNPLKIFLLMSVLVFAAAVVSLVLALLLRLTFFLYIGMGGILMSIQVFCLGLLAVLLRQIVIKE